VAADPSDAEMRNQLARSYLYAGEYQKGLDVLAPLLTENQASNWVAMNLYMKSGRFDEAIEMGRRLTVKNPNGLVSWLDLGVVLKAAGQLDRARATWKEGARRGEALVSNFENVRTRIWLSHFYAEIGENEQALEQARRALAAEPDDPWCFISLRRSMPF
jgi:tetratricopeptide (TPR) repeat protein